MLKLVRNTFAEKRSVVDGENTIVKWQFIQCLHKLQEDEELHLGNKLRNAHIEWFKKKINVKLAAQLLSESVACSLGFCLQKQYQEFEGCKATIKFIRVFNNLFDILNSRNLNAFGWKSPFQDKNYMKYVEFLKEAKTYILFLKQSISGRPILQSNRKSGFLGFLICIDSLLSLYDNVITSQRYGMKFLITFKFSQDHIELFFGKIRSLGRCNNNSTAMQFSDAYKQLLINIDIQDILRGNSLPLQTVPILTISSACNNDNDVEGRPP